MIEIKFDIPNNFMKIDTEYLGAKDLDVITNIYFEDIKSKIPVRSGQTYSNTVVRKESQNSRIIIGKGKSANVWEWLLKGTKSHLVMPVNKLALSWTNGAQRFFSKGHIVSGIKARPQLIEVSQKVLTQITEYLNKRNLWLK